MDQSLKSIIDLVVVTYNSEQVVRTFLRSLPSSVKPIVVDNGSSDVTVSLATAGGAEVIALKRNIGYGSACNIGASAGQAPYLLFVNPDIRFEEGAIEALLEAAKAHPNAAFNPCLYHGSRRRFRRWSRLLPKSEFWQGAPPVDDCEIPVLSGACIFIRREHFEGIQGFDQAIFLFHEDDDLSVRLRQAGIRLRIACKAIVEHAEGNSSNRSISSSRIKGEAMGRSLVYVMRKHNLTLNIYYELLRSYSKLLLPHVFSRSSRRAKLWGFIKGISDRNPERHLELYAPNPVKESETVIRKN